MDHYVDLKLRPDPEFSPPMLMNALFAKLHRALVSLASERIGVSFPDHDARAPHLGLCLRLHGQRPDLDALSGTGWLHGMRDHLVMEDALPRPVPTQSAHRVVQRVQADSNPERLRRRLMRRHGMDEAEARTRIPDSAARWLDLPYVQLRSTSTGQPFRLFIAHGPIQTTAQPGLFSAYGLSPTATVPWF
jgi:CRISPR-associated endonuclease Csy4